MTVWKSRTLLVALGLGLLLASGCGGDADDAGGQEEAEVRTGHWQHVWVDGVEDATGIALLDGRALLSTRTGRALHVVDVASREHGATLPSRAIEIQILEDARVTGADDIARQGYTLGDLWGKAIDIQGIAAQAPHFVFLAEARHRVVYRGNLMQAPDRSWASVLLERVYAVPGADRPGATASDWRDVGEGLSGIDSVQGARRTEDLYLVERSAAEPGTFRIVKMDRMGLVLGLMTGRLPEGGPAEVEDIVREGDRYLVVRGEGRGLIHAVRDGRWRETVKTGDGVPGPDVEGAGAWRGFTRTEDGTFWLVSAGPKTAIAWRSPRAP